MTFANDYCTRLTDDLGTVGRARWDALIAADAQSNPLLCYAFLDALHGSGAARPASGWLPQYLLLERNGELAAAAPLYAKDHSYGEYVFDWAWAEAYARYGLSYYPKWLVAIPFTPVPGARLLAVDDTARTRLARALTSLARESALSSLHVLLAPPRDIEALAAQGMLIRRGVQFHWHNRGFVTFDDFLDRLAQPKRKKIRAERRKVRDAAVSIERRCGSEISAENWRFFHRCYRNTYAAHWSTPYLNLDFFRRIGETMPQNLMLVLAHRGGRPIASALGIHDQRRLYGRYWGALEQVPCLHFECCYYQMIEFAIERRIAIFEGGAQGAHKIARGLDPVETLSAHWLADAAMHDAVARFVARETISVEHSIDEMNEHRAWRHPAQAIGSAPESAGAD